METPRAPFHGVVVEDDQALRTAIIRLLRLNGILAVGVGSVEELVAVQEIASFAWALVDIRLPGECGFVAATFLRDRAPGIRIVMMTGTHEPGHRSRAREAGAYHYVVKPLREAELIAALKS